MLSDFDDLCSESDGIPKLVVSGPWYAMRDEECSEEGEFCIRTADPDAVGT